MASDCALEEEQPLLQTPLTRGTLQRRITIAVYASLCGNVLLLLVKAWAFLVSYSMALLASLMDSVVDLASQAVIAWADWEQGRDSENFPAGKARLETISVLVCAYIMTVGAIQVVMESSHQLVDGFTKGVLPELDMNIAMYSILAATTVLKLLLWCYCFTLRHASGAAMALAEDHMNDVASNLGAVLGAAVAAQYRPFWWADPVGGILISLWIAGRWAVITKRQVEKVVGRTAPPEFLQTLTELVSRHHPACGVGYLRAYHAGQRLAVDVELTAPATMTVAEAAGIAKDLKHRIEALPEVECASVFVTASDASRPLHSPLMAPARRSKPHTTHTDLEELVEGLGSTPATSPGAVSPKSPKSPRGRVHWGGVDGDEQAAAQQQQQAQQRGQQQQGQGIAMPQPEPRLPGWWPAGVDLESEGGEGWGGGSRSAPLREHLLSASVPSSVLRSPSGSLRRGSTGQEPALARQLVWSRSLKDAPERVLRSAALSTPDTAAMSLSKLGRRSMQQLHQPEGAQGSEGGSV